ncbi:hypothetical protein B0H11DRAFT_2229731 [Mycena galericulata]|nr:hypothetical protein B0H11DRAFT_2229731 [Mycena galericulata]
MSRNGNRRLRPPIPPTLDSDSVYLWTVAVATSAGTASASSNLSTYGLPRAGQLGRERVYQEERDRHARGTHGAFTGPDVKGIEGPACLDDVSSGKNYNGYAPRERQSPTRVVRSITSVSSTEPVLGCVFLILSNLVFSTDLSTVTRSERWPLTVDAAVERVVAGWVRLTVFDPKVNFVMSGRYWLAGTGARPRYLSPGSRTYNSDKGYYIQLLGWPGTTTS